MSKIAKQIKNAQSRAERTAFEKLLTNPDMPMMIRRRTVKGVSSIFRIAKKLGFKPPDIAVNVTRSWRPAPSNEPGEKRIGAIRRRFPKPVTFYKEDLYDKLYYYLERENEFIDGRWSEHWGDAAFYGIISDALRWRMIGDAKALERAIHSRRANLSDIVEARSDPRKLLENGEGAMMAALGLIMTFDLLPHWETVPQALDVLSSFNCLMESIGGYINIDLPIAFADYYGRTTPTAMFFLVNLMVADFLKRHDRSIMADQWVSRALKFLDAAKAVAYDYQGPRYLFNPNEKRLFCYPNPLFCLGLTILHRITGHQSALMEAEGLFDWMHKNLHDDVNGGYWTPYVNMLRKKQYALNLKSLSGQNYILFAAIYLYDATRKEIYLNEIKSILDMYERDFYHGGLLWHDVEEGVRATLTNPEPYCIGCNLMTTYLLAEINYTFQLGDKLFELEGVKIQKKNARRLVQAAGIVPGMRPIKIAEEPGEEDLF